MLYGVGVPGVVVESGPAAWLARDEAHFEFVLAWHLFAACCKQVVGESLFVFLKVAVLL